MSDSLSKACDKTLALLKSIAAQHDEINPMQCRHCLAQEALMWESSRTELAQFIEWVGSITVALKQLRIDANRLCDRQLGGSYERDCRAAIKAADAVLAALNPRKRL